MIIKKTSTTPEQKLNDLLNHTTQVHDCLEWKGCYNTDGYARMGGNVKVHRLVYSLKHNTDPVGYVVRHTCDNIRCINPDHLLVGTPADNNKDRQERGRAYRTTTKGKVFRTLELLATKALSQKEIALIVGLNPRRVSDINCGLYCSATGNFLGRG